LHSLNDILTLALHRGPEGERSGSSIQLNAPATLTLTADPDRLRQVVNNLLLNAIKYGNRTPVSISLEQQGSEAVLTVSDQGTAAAWRWKASWEEGLVFW
jgi:signal transduction histidine kinase